MKASVYTKYGSSDELELKDVEKPTPKDDVVLIKILRHPSMHMFGTS
jgi:NADPH:quinone reductase-like Zn-dependent oxidoreductase